MRSHPFIRTAMALALVVLGAAGMARSQSMQILNAKSGDALDYPLAFLYGSTTAQATEVKVGGIVWPVRGGHFKALVRLKPGVNDIAFEFGAVKETFTLRFMPKVNPKFVRVVYFLGSDQDGAFESPAGMPNQVADAVARIKLASLLMQTFYAESWKRTVESVRGTQGLAKKTFRLETDANGEPIIHVVKSTQRTAAQWRAIASNTAYGQAHTEIRSKLGGSATYKQAVIMGFSNRQHYVDQTAAGTGVAWGGGSLNGSGNGATSGCTLYAWAPTLEGFVGAFTNKTVPEAGLCRDWNKATYMGNYSTTLGGWYHEIGHTFGLGHTAYGIMSGQIDQIYRFFMIEDVSRNNQVLSPANELPNTWWHSSEVGTPDSDYFTVTPFSSAIRIGVNGRVEAARAVPFSGVLCAGGSSCYSLDGRNLGSLRSVPNFPALP